MVYNLMVQLDDGDNDPEPPEHPAFYRHGSSYSSGHSSSLSAPSQFAVPPTTPQMPSQPNYGRRLLPTTIDQIARGEPGRIWASLPYDDGDLSKGYEDISYARFADAINKLSWAIVLAIGTSSTFETIAYFGPADVRYYMMQMAACKTGHKVLFSSALNSDETHLSLLEELQCKAIFTSSTVDVASLLERWPVVHYVVPELDTLLNESGNTDEYVYTKTFEEAQFDPFFVLHTSGTSGKPKVVLYNHAKIAAFDVHRTLPGAEGKPVLLLFAAAGPGTRMLIPSPPYHVGAAYNVLSVTVFGGDIFVPGFRHRIPRLDELSEIIKHANLGSAILMPRIMEHIARRPDGDQYMKGLQRVFFGGSTLSLSAASKWTQHTHLQNIWGSTEIVAPVYLRADNDDHEYCVLDIVHSGIDFRPTNTVTNGTDGIALPLFQAVMMLTPESEPTAAWYKGMCITNATKPPPTEHDTGDLFTPHPDPAKAHYMWKFAGRADDMMTFKTGNNFYRGDVEKDVSSHALVRAALVVGFGHAQALLLIELAEGVGEEALSTLWEQVVTPMNRRIPLSGYVARTHVLLVPCGEFVRTLKGSVARRPTEDKLADSIEAVYEQFGDVPPTMR